MNVKKILAAFLVAATLTAAPAAYALEAEADAKESKDNKKAEKEAELYDRGTEAIDDEEWEHAIRAFTKVAEMQGSRADGAVFWSAYAMNKLGRKAEALKTIDGLKRTYPKSRWIDDAQALELELRQSRGERVAPEHVGGDDDLKMMAINSLMSTDPQKAFPLLAKIVRNRATSQQVRERALFVLSQSPLAEARSLMSEIARGNSNPDLQKEAVKYLGINATPENRKLLGDLYSSAASDDVKKEVLHAYMISGDKARVLSAARGERDPELRKEAIHMLGVMGGRAELGSMYGSETSVEAREAIIDALFISGDTTRMGELARTERNTDLRAAAIQKLGLMGNGTASTLTSMYASETNSEVKGAIIDALFLQNNARALIDIAKKEKNREVRNEALQKLSIMQNDEALQYMLQILEQ
ncbi:MAG: HEAT repeat domain-containing protein [Acidobacteriota bacterium]|nr:HEAT repeat domain-containing protein [Acidobacteriota bacterium]